MFNKQRQKRRKKISPPARRTKILDLPLISGEVVTGEKSTLKFSYFLLYICGDWCILCEEQKG